MHYAQAWSMVHYFFARPRLKQVLLDYLGALRQGKSARDAFTATFGKLDLAATQRAWRKHVKALR